VPSLGVGAIMTTDPRSVAGVVGVSIPFPVFDRAQGTRARARAELAAADADQRALLAETSAEAERAARQLAMKRASLARLEQSALTRLPTLARMAEDAYREGAGGVVALLDASTAERDLRLSRASLAAEVLHAEIDVLAATGAILETTGP
jgi:outer membrane protein, heavy metal efflux system